MAMDAARALVNSDGPARQGTSHVDPSDWTQRRNAVSEAIALVVAILSVAAWTRPLERALGPDALLQAIRFALPITLALQWALRSRYLSRRQGLALLAQEAPVVLVSVALLVFLPLAIQGDWGLTAALMAAIWIAGTVVTRRGWGMYYALTLVVATVGLELASAPYAVLGAVTALVLILCIAALRTTREHTDDRPGPVPRMLLAAPIGGALGILLVADPSLGWGVHGVHPAIALLPSVIGGFWGGYHLWNLYDAVPEGLSGVPLDRASRAGLTDPAMRVFGGALLRFVVASVALSAVVIAISPWTGGTDAPSVFIAFGCAALLSMLVSLLDSLAVHRIAIIAVGLAVASELAWRSFAPMQVAGGALALGAAVGVLVALPVLVALLLRTGRVLATALWIH